MAKREETSGIIHPDELYTLEALKKRLAIKDATLRTARRSGLPVYYKHGRGYIRGSDWIQYVCSLQNKFVSPAQGPELSQQVASAVVSAEAR